MSDTPNYQEMLSNALNNVSVESSTGASVESVSSTGASTTPTYIQVIVKTLSGQTASIEIDSKKNVSDLQDKLTEKLGIPQSDQRLIFGGKQLDPDQPLETYNISEGSLITMVLRLRGGNFKGAHK